MGGELKVGILSLQGAVEPHAEKLKALGAEPVKVRVPAHLDGLSGIILPGGESTTMLHLLGLNDLWNPLERFLRERPSFGVCAGLILLAAAVSRPRQKSFGALPVSVDRNGYGRQVDSFTAPLEPTEAWPHRAEPLEGVFIRAPRITAHGPEVTVLARFRGEPVLVESGRVLAGTFHPELTASTRVHQYFLGKCQA